MKKKILFLMVLTVLTAIGSLHINLENNQSGNLKSLFLSLSSVEALAGKESTWRCLFNSDYSKNKGVCVERVNGTGYDCISPSWWMTPNCYAVEE